MEECEGRANVRVVFDEVPYFIKEREFISLPEELAERLVKEGLIFRLAKAEEEPKEKKKKKEGDR